MKPSLSVRIVLLLAVFIALIGGVCWWIVTKREPTPTPRTLSAFSRTVTEGFSYRCGAEPFPRVSCDACRTGKKKLGLLTLGGFNVLELDNLIVNLPPDGGDERMVPDRAKQGGTGGVSERSAAHELLEELGVGPVSKELFAAGKPRISGLKIKGLSLNRMSGQVLLPVLKAERLQTEGRHLVLRGLNLFDKAGATEIVPEATLEVHPSPALVWPGRRLPLTNLLHSLSQ